MFSTRSKVRTRQDAVSFRDELGRSGRRLVFTNGCFDLLHPGHVQYLEAARELGDALMVAINTDASVRRNKGPERPIIPQDERAEILAALRAVDCVTTFDADTPADIIAAVVPDILVKGADWAPDQVVGREVVEANGGRVVLVPVVEGFSTSRIVRAIRDHAEPLT